jgi:pyruvate kinase
LQPSKRPGRVRPMALPAHKTKIVATIGPASSDPAVMEAMIRAGMSVARLNFSHGTLEEKMVWVLRLRAAASAVGRRLAILADLPGPKLRIGELAEEPIELVAGQPFRITTEPVRGTRECVGVDFPELPQRVKPGQILFLNDGQVQVEVERVEGGRFTGVCRSEANCDPAKASMCRAWTWGCLLSPSGIGSVCSRRGSWTSRL